MKTKYLILVSLLCSTLLNNLLGQNIEVTHQSNGTVLSVPVQSVDSTVFQLSPPPALKKIYQNNGNILGIAMDDVDSITYNIPNSSTLPQVTTVSANVLSSSSAFLSGNISADGGSTVTERGFCWSTSQTPTLANNSSQNGNNLGSFDFTVQPLSPATTYFVRAYATNANGTAYGNVVTFSTSNPNSSGGLPVVETEIVSYSDGLTAVTGGDITDDGGLAVTSRGVCWVIGTTTTPTINNNITNDGAGGGSFQSTINNLLPGTSYFVRAYATNDAGTSYGITYSFTTNELPVVNTIDVELTNINVAHVTGEAISNGGSNISSRGFCWSTSPNPTINDDSISAGSGLGFFDKTIDGLHTDTTYYVRAYTVNNIGIAYGSVMSFSTLTLTCLTTSTAIIEVTNPQTGATWMDRNLGATLVAANSTDVASYGDLYQWGRGEDGHQCRTSETTETLSSVDQPGHGDFIIASAFPGDWRSPENHNLWQGVNGINNPCPNGYRLPTDTEWEAERSSWNSSDAAGAFSSPLKLPVAGQRNGSDGSLIDIGTGQYWSSTVSTDFGLASRFLLISSNSSSLETRGRANGLSIRCIKN